MTLNEALFRAKDDKYKKFQLKLIPGYEEQRMIGVRMPALRKIHNDYKSHTEFSDMIKTLPHSYYEEDILHGLYICDIADADELSKELDRFLPYIDNWAVCDLISPKACKTRPKRLLSDIDRWTASKHEYTVRFGIGLLMKYCLEEGFDKSQLELVSNITSDKYYIKMMAAWYFATALAIRWDETLPYIEKRLPDDFVHRKTIQKAVESFRIPDGKKEYLKTLR